MLVFKDKALHGKIAIITGGSGFLGQQHCLALLEKGAIVINFDIVPFLDTALISAFRDRFFTIICDISLEQNVKEAFQQVVDQHGKVDILVNNAFIDCKVPANLENNKLNFKFEDFDFSSWKKELDVGLTGAIFCCKYASKNMISNNSGVIINISSDLGVIAPDQKVYQKKSRSTDQINFYKPFSYSVIKHGLIGLTKYLSTYLSDYGIRVNTLSPGSVFNNQDPEFIKKLESTIPLKRLATVNEYKGAIQFLASDDSSYMTGQNLIIDGGRSIW
jgi:NAD(P)-dependent dehydrogenase (short-subunit alcohol dehydrogenase family)